MRILILDTYYPSFLSFCYQQNPGLAELPYEDQWQRLQDECFGTADFYSEGLKKLGHEATEIVTNCEPLQRAWEREHNISIENATRSRRRLLSWLRGSPANGWHDQILAAQIREWRPDVLYVQDMNSLSPEFLRAAKQHARFVAGQIACPIAAGMTFNEYDLVLSSFPHFVDRFRREGLQSEHFKLGFGPRVREHLVQGKHYPVVFVGSLSASHQGRTKFLERIAAAVPLDVWGPGAETLHSDSPLRARHHGEAWALDMYRVLHQADLVLNHHIDLAEDYANNMRLYEATGVGSLLVTDWKKNLDRIFEPGREVVPYHDADEAIELIKYYLDHPDEQKQIAAGGQQRTLREHTYSERMKELSSILEKIFGGRG